MSSPNPELELKLGAAAVKAVCGEYRIHNADVHMRDDCDIDELVDVIEGSRVYIPAIYVINKIDQITLEELEVMSRCAQHSGTISRSWVDSIHLDSGI